MSNIYFWGKVNIFNLITLLLTLVIMFLYSVYHPRTELNVTQDCFLFQAVPWRRCVDLQYNMPKVICVQTVLQR